MDFAERVLALAEATRGLNRPSCPAETGAIVLLIFLFFLFFAPVIGRFSARVFSFAVSMAFPVFGAHRRPVNRLYFFEGVLSTSARLAAPVAGLPAAQPDVVTRPDFSLLPLFCALFFSIVSHCSCAGGFLLVLSRRCIVFRISFPIADRLYLFFPGAFRPTRSTRGRRVASIGAASRWKNTVPAMTSARTLMGLALFGANPKTVESIPLLKLQDVGSSHSVDAASLRRRRSLFGTAPAVSS